MAGLREIAEDRQARIERLCLSDHGVDIVMRDARVVAHERTTPTAQLGSGLLEVLGRPLARRTPSPDEEKELFVRRGYLQLFSHSRRVGAARQRPGARQVEPFDPSEDDRMNSIELRSAEIDLSRTGSLKSSLPFALATILAVFLAVCLSF